MAEGEVMIRVGIIGASPERGWALRAHVPALRHLPEYEITAVGTSRMESARQAAAKFGATHAFTDARQLAGHPDVDLVTITVKVPEHAELVQAALDAGKHVYCEWPLARTTGEAELLAKSARDAGVRNVVGLQARYAPAVRRARELIADGSLGRITSATLYAARGKGAGEEIPGWTAYTYDNSRGAGLLEVYGGHALDTLEFLVGDISDVSAMLSIQRPRHTITETGHQIEVTSPDHLLLNARLSNGSVASVHVHDGKAGESVARLEITGTRGDLTIVSEGSDDPMGVQLQISPLRLRGAELPEPDHAMPVEARNVAAVYAQLAEDIRTGNQRTPDFEEGLKLHRLLDAIRRS